MRLAINDLERREKAAREIKVEHERKLPCSRCGRGPGQLMRPCTCKLTVPAISSRKLEKAT